jgi:protein-tyrosine phosphatase
MRRLPLDGAENFRDLGGYSTAQGSTNWGQIYRADELSALSQADLAFLADRRLRTVVDLRLEKELLQYPSVYAEHASVRYHHNPVVVTDTSVVGFAERLQTLDFRAHNVAMIKESAATFAYLFRLLGQPEAYPLVFHCAGGRDRTGVAAALILTAAGVPRDVVISDYLLSNQYLVQRMSNMSAAFREKGIDPQPILANLELREDYLIPMLDTVEGEFGGIDAYLFSAGVTEQELAAFRRQLLHTLESDASHS